MNFKRWLSDRVGAVAWRLMCHAYAYQLHQLLAQCAEVGENVRLHMPASIYEPENLRLGSHVAIADNVHIRASGGVTIGDHVLIASHVVITSRSHPLALPRWTQNLDAPVTIANDVWIGAGAILLPGVTIGEGAVVAAGAVVTKDVPPRTVAAGVPAKVVRSLDEEPEGGTGGPAK